MTSRYGFVHLRPTRPLTSFRRTAQPFHTSLRLYSDSKDESNDQAPPTAPSLLSEQIRTYMRLTPHPLTSIVSYTKEAHSPKTGKSKPCALLVSTFNTINLGPTPHVSFNIKTPSSTYNAMLESNLFVASGLRSARVAHAFVKQLQRNENGQGWESMLEEEVKGRGMLREGGIWWMQCQLIGEKCMHVGDHVVVVAVVLKAGGYEQANGLGLIYVDGKYREVGKIVDPREKNET